MSVWDVQVSTRASDTVRSLQRPPPGVAGVAHVRLQGDENGLPATSGSLFHLLSSSEAESISGLYNDPSVPRVRRGSKPPRGTLTSENLLRNIWSDEKVALSRLLP